MTPSSPVDHHASTPAELQERLAAESAGTAFLVLRDGDGRQQVHPLDGATQELTLGRGIAADVRIGWDPGVSRLHAVLACRAGTWTVVDDGVSANGTAVNGVPLRGSRRLDDGDTLRLGDTLVVFRKPTSEAGDEATVRAAAGAPPRVSAAQRRVLVALARPYRAGGEFATPATNQEIAADVVLTVDAVKAHLRQLFERFGISDLPQNVKRVRLVELAFVHGVVTEHDFE